MDDGFGDHPKVQRAGPLAAWLHVRGMCYVARYLTDGFLPKVVALGLAASVLAQARELGDTEERLDPQRLVDRLVDAELLEPAPDGYVVHDWADWNPPAAKVRAAQRSVTEQRRWAGKRSAERRSEARSSSPFVVGVNVDVNGEVNETATAEATNVQREAQQNGNPVPVPVPDQILPSVGSAPLAPRGDEELDPWSLTPCPAAETSAKRRRGVRRPKTALPSTFGVSPDIEAMARAEGLPDPHVVIRDFRDKALANAYRYADWEAAFRCWMRSDLTRRSYPPVGQTSPPMPMGLRPRRYAQPYAELPPDDRPPAPPPAPSARDFDFGEASP
jgi:hypothetical protein